MALFVRMTGTEMVVQLDNRDHSIYFAELHIFDLLAAMRADETKTAINSVSRK